MCVRVRAWRRREGYKERKLTLSFPLSLAPSPASFSLNERALSYDKELPYGSQSMLAFDEAEPYALVPPTTIGGPELNAMTTECKRGMASVSFTAANAHDSTLVDNSDKWN